VRPLGRLDDLEGTLIQDGMVISFHANPDYFVRSRHSYLPQIKAIFNAQ